MNIELLRYKFKHIPKLHTERLVLRPMSVSDYEDMYDYAKSGELTKYLLWSPHPSSEYTKKYLKFVEKRYRMGDFYDWAIEEKSSGRMIGSCGFTTIDIEHRKGEIGYVINPTFHRCGYAVEAAQAIIEFGFYDLDLNRIECRIMKENEPSFKVAKKLGMTFEGYMRDALYVKGSYRTIGMCSILKEEFEIRKNNE